MKYNSASLMDWYYYHTPVGRVTQKEFSFSSHCSFDIFPTINILLTSVYNANVPLKQSSLIKIYTWTGEEILYFASISTKKKGE